MQLIPSFYVLNYVKVLFILYIFLNCSLCFGQEIQQNYAAIQKSTHNEKLLVGYQLNRLASRKSKFPVKQHVSKLQWIAKTQVPQYLTEKSAIKINKGSLGVKSIGSNAFHYALTVAGIGASTAILDDYSKTGEIHLDKSLDFLSDSNFLRGSMGIFIGSTAFSILGNFLPPGVGAIIKTVPGFLGAAVGLSVAENEKINWPKVLLSSLASSAAFVALGSGGLLAIGAGIAASMISDAIFENIQLKLKSDDDIPEFQPNRLHFSQENPLNHSTFIQKPLVHQSSEDAKSSQRLLLEIEESAAANDALKTKALLNSLEQIGSVR